MEPERYRVRMWQVSTREPAWIWYGPAVSDSVFHPVIVPLITSIIFVIIIYWLSYPGRCSLHRLRFYIIHAFQLSAVNLIVLLKQFRINTFSKGSAPPGRLTAQLHSQSANYYTRLPPRKPHTILARVLDNRWHNKYIMRKLLYLNSKRMPLLDNL